MGQLAYMETQCLPTDFRCSVVIRFVKECRENVSRDRVWVQVSQAPHLLCAAISGESHEGNYSLDNASYKQDT